MIAACPKCHTRYRVQPEQLGADGARLRCSSCNAVFRVRPPASSAAEGRAARSEPKASEAHQAASDRSAPTQAAREGTAPASATAVFGGGARSPQGAGGAAQRGESERSSSGSQASEVHQDAGADRPLRRNDGLEGHRSDPTSQDAPEPGPRYDRERLVVVAHADADVAKDVADALEGWGLQALVAHDGVEAMLGIQRTLPSAVVLDAALPKMYGFQVCEIVKRNESLRETRVVLVGAIHKEERYRRAPRDLYGADVYVEPPDLPDALLEILTRFGLPLRSDAAPSPHAPRPDAPYGHIARGTHAAPRDSRTEPLLPEPAGHEVAERATTRSSEQGGPASGAAEGRAARSEPKASEVHQDASADLRPASRPPAQPAAAPAAPTPADPLAAERAKAERLARIIVSDIVLYNPEKFAAAAQAGGDVAAAMRDELEEGRALFRERIDAQVRAERDHLAEELARAAKARSGT